MNFQRIVESWLERSPKLRNEHKTYKGLLDNLTEELVKLATLFAGHVQWKSYSDYQPKYPGTKGANDGWRRAKMALEQFSSTDESEEDVPQETTAEKEAW